MESAIVDICDCRSVAVGSGVAILPRGLVVTCAHVVADSLSMDRNSPSCPERQVNVEFRANGKGTKADVVAWSPTMESDIAILRVEDDAIFQLVTPVPLFHVSSLRGSRFRTYGFPKGYVKGRWSYGELLDNVPGGLVQLRSPDLVPGFSGGPVQELQMGRVIGLLARYDPQFGLGFAISAGQIARLYPEAQVTRVESRFSPITDGLSGLPGDPLTGLEMFLSEYLGTAEEPRAFGGRQEQIRQLEAWFADSHAATAIISAPAGRGKSALVARWAAGLASEGRAEVVFVPISIRFNTAQKLRVAMLIGARLRYLADRSLRGTVDSADPEQWMAEIGQRLREDRREGTPKLLMVLDGLDEATDWRAGEDLTLPPALGAGVKILCTARTLANDKGPMDWVERLHWPSTTPAIDLQPLNSVGVAEVLRSMGAALVKLAANVGLVSELARLSEGDPLLVSLYAHALAGSVQKGPFLDPKELRSIPAGLDGFFETWWRDQRKQWGPHSPLREPGVQAILNLLCSALGPLSHSDLLELAPAELTAWSLDETMEPLSRFVIGDGRAQGFVFAHPRLGQYFRTKLNAGELLKWNTRFTLYGSRVVERLRTQKLRPEDSPTYILQNLTAHLDRAVCSPEMYYALLHESYVKAWEYYDGSFSGFIRDVARIWEVAERNGNLVRQIACAIAHSSLVGLRTLMPPGLISQGLRQGHLTESQVMGLMSSSATSEETQSRIISLIAPILSSRAKDALFLKAHEFHAEAKTNALVGLTPYLPESRLSDVIDVGHAIAMDGYPLLDKLADRLRNNPSDGLVDQLLTAVQALEDQDARAALFTKLAPILNKNLAGRLLIYARTMEKPSARAEVLALAAPFLGSHLLPEAMAAANEIWYPYRKALALCAVAELAPSTRQEAVAAAFEAVKEIREPDRRAETLIRLAKVSGEETRDAALKEALAVIDEETGGNRRVELLRMFPVALSPTLSEIYLRVASKWVDGLQRITFLTHFAAAQAPDRRKVILREALDLVKLVSEAEVPAAMARIGQVMPEEMTQEVLSAAKSGAAELAVVCYLPEDQELSSVTERLWSVLQGEKAYFGNADLYYVWPKLRELSARFHPRSNDFARDLLAGLEPSRTYGSYGPDWLTWVEAMVWITPRCTTGLSDETIGSLLSGIAGQRDKSRVAVGLELLSPLLEGKRLSEAISIARRIGDREVCSSTLDSLQIPLRTTNGLSEAQAYELTELAEQAHAAYPGCRFSVNALSCVLSAGFPCVADRGLALLTQLPLVDQARTIQQYSAISTSNTVRRLTTDWLARASALWNTEESDDQILAGLDELKKAIPKDLIFDCLRQIPERVSKTAGGIKLVLSLTFRLSAQERLQAFENARRLIRNIENPVARVEAITELRGTLVYAAIEEIRTLLTDAAVRDPIFDLAEIFSYLHFRERAYLLPEFKGAMQGKDFTVSASLMAAVAPLLPKDEVLEWLVAELLEHASGESPLEVLLPHAVPVATHLPAAERGALAQLVADRLGDFGRIGEDALIALAALAGEPLRYQAVSVLLSRPGLSPSTTHELVKLIHSNDALSLLLREELPWAWVEQRSALSALLSEEDARTFLLCKGEIPSAAALSLHVAVNAMLPIDEFLQKIKASRNSWPWDRRGLHDHFDLVSTQRLANERFQSHEEVQTVLRFLGDLERPECLTVLSHLAKGIEGFAGISSSFAISGSVMQIAKWWP